MAVTIQNEAVGVARTGAGRANLVFAVDPDGETFLREQFTGYPFHICKPYRYANDPAGMATLYLQSLAGGIYQGDRLSLGITAEAGAKAHVTTQASTIIQGMERGDAEQGVTVTAAPDSLVEYLPDPAILFPRSRLTSRVRVVLDPGALVMLSESFLCHDPKGEGQPFDWLLSDIVIQDVVGTTLVRDRFRTSGPDFVAQLSGLSGVRAAQGAFYVVGHDTPGDRLVDALRAGIDGQDAIYGGASVLPNGCGAWARLAAPDGAALRAALLACWSAVRHTLLGCAPDPRRK